MNKNELALSLIRAPLKAKLLDRSFVLTVFVTSVGFYLFQQKAIDAQQFIDLMKWVLIWAFGNQFKDALIGSSAVRPDAPANIAAGGDVTTKDNEDESTSQDG